MQKNKKIELSTIIGKGSKISGNFNIKGGVRISGDVEGEIVTDGFITVSQTGYAKANIKAKECLVAGRVDGNIVVDDALELDKTAIVNGDIIAKALSIHTGAVLNGQCEMKNKENK